jgi:cell pole-organizing protein PopZ
MEEILASIRRIIEDSDTGRRPDSEAGIVKPDNDAVPPPAARSVEDAQEDEDDIVIDVEAFRSELRADEAAAKAAPAIVAEPHAKPEPSKTVSLADVHAIVEADRTAARAAAELDYHGEAARTPEPVAFPDARKKATGGAEEWRLGIPAQSTAREQMDSDFPEMVAALTTQALSAARSSSEETSAPQRPAIISEQAGRQVAAAFGELSDAFAARSRRSFDEMASEMLRPMLQDWLDNNLPIIVERLVREEIERVARGHAG